MSQEASVCFVHLSSWLRIERHREPPALHEDYGPAARDRTYPRTRAISSSDSTNLHIPIAVSDTHM
jgi:hypothetical protein